MSKAVKHTIISFVTLLGAVLVLFLLVEFDRSERSFYSSGGIVYFVQYFILTAGIVSLIFSSLAIWHAWVQPVKTATYLGAIFIHFPLLVGSALLTYAGLLFFLVI